MSGQLIPNPVKERHECEFPPGTVVKNKYDWELKEKYQRLYLDPNISVGDYWRCECGRIWKLAITDHSYLKFNREWRK